MSNISINSDPNSEQMRNLRRVYTREIEMQSKWNIQNAGIYEAFDDFSNCLSYTQKKQKNEKKEVEGVGENTYSTSTAHDVEMGKLGMGNEGKEPKISEKAWQMFTQITLSPPLRHSYHIWTATVLENKPIALCIR